MKRLKEWWNTPIDILWVRGFLAGMMFILTLDLIKQFIISSGVLQ